MVREILIKYPPMIQQASVDEFYMDFTGCEKIYGNPMLLAERLLQEIYDKVKLPGSIGIGSNKTIAKICSDFNKPRGITYVAPGMEKDFLAPLPAETMPGVGKVFIEELHARGIYTIGDIARMPAEYFASVFGKGGLDIWEKANGKGTEYISEGKKEKVSQASRHSDRIFHPLQKLKPLCLVLLQRFLKKSGTKGVWQPISISNFDMPIFQPLPVQNR
ncbi:MAG: hypothetical protein IPG53_03560 [Ignavibacteriales bacterium]|nr:hypothetical protein [Ignavibacteriales bacterium]